MDYALRGCVLSSSITIVLQYVKSKWTHFRIAPPDRHRPRRRMQLRHNNLKWWAHLDSTPNGEAVRRTDTLEECARNQGPTDYEGKLKGRRLRLS